MVHEYKKILYAYYRTMFRLHVCNSKILNTINIFKKIMFSNQNYLKNIIHTYVINGPLTFLPSSPKL